MIDPNSVTLDEAETIRTEIGMSLYPFSLSLNLSTTAYSWSRSQGKLSRRIQLEVCHKYGLQLEAIRSKAGRGKSD